MKKQTILSLATLWAASMFVGCNSDYTPAENTTSCVAVYSFGFAADDSVLLNLDTVFFSVDLERARIFNADSLPYGTRINKLVPRVVTAETASGINFIARTASGQDTVYNYVTNPDDTIDFSQSPVYLDIVSLSGTATRRYTIDVNVHKVKSDSLAWSTPWLTKIPGMYDTPTAQKTVENASGVYTLTTDGSAWVLAHAYAPERPTSGSTITMPEDEMQIESFTATDDAFYILGRSGQLYVTHNRLQWEPTHQQWHAIYGAYGSRLLGVRSVDGHYEAVEYPANPDATPILPEGMPVEGTSVPVAFSFPMSSSEQIIIVGGRTADGTLSPHTWGFDGTAWTRLSTKPLPEGLSEMTVVPFFTFKVNQLFVATEYAVMLAFGGQSSTGLSRTVYMSWDYGMKWVKASTLMQLPEAIPTMRGAQAYVYNLTFDDYGTSPSRSGDGWQPLDYSPRLPYGAMIVPPSRATTPVESWECPYIYLYGGYDAQGVLQPHIWRGTINRLEFKPLI